MTTPLLEQYNEIKKRHPSTILFFRLGDFYEMFNEDARTASKVLGITLTSRFKGKKAIPMAGVPHHAAENYIKKFLDNGYRVAVCDQIEDAKEAKGLVDRDVVRIITPGTLIEEDFLVAKKSNFLLSIIIDKNEAGISWLDISTGQFYIKEIHLNNLRDEITRISPTEILVPESYQFDDNKFRLKDEFPEILVSYLGDWAFEEENAYKTLCSRFGTANLNGFGCEDITIGISAAGAVVEYISQNRKDSVELIQSVTPIFNDTNVYIDKTTLSSLEILRSFRRGDERGTLIEVMDKTSTPMGGRLIRQYLTSPLKTIDEINERLEIVSLLFNDYETRKEIREALNYVYDIERITARIVSRRAAPRDLVALKITLQHIPLIKNAISKYNLQGIKKLNDKIEILDEVKSLIESAIISDPPNSITEGGIIKEGYNSELDELRKIKHKGNKWLAEFQAKEIERSGINSLKIGYNKVFGYYIEITNTHSEKIPNNYIRKQTLKNAERYITEELKIFEDKILSADDKIKELEYSLYVNLRETLAGFSQKLILISQQIAKLDVLTTFAQISFENKYTCPVITEKQELIIKEGRHPVLEMSLKGKFVSNDVELTNTNKLLAIITGPNMSGKSTYIRQTALIVLMAQCGCFVPAKSATIGIADRIFTRIGASDEIARGASTFMVEMNETANILNNATNRSLIILDEIGRGTSTYDGISIAWAIAKHIVTKIQARTLFATHYHELTELQTIYKNVFNLHVSIKEWNNNIVFVHKISQGSTDKSYGIHVANLAGIPTQITANAYEILKRLEAGPLKETLKNHKDKKQLALFKEEDPLAVCINSVDLDNITPLQALVKLEEIIELWRNKM